MTSHTPSLIERLEPVTTGDAGRTVDAIKADMTRLESLWGKAFLASSLHGVRFEYEALKHELRAALSSAKGSAQP